jgi:HK97 gp10 family phage protein
MAVEFEGVETIIKSLDKIVSAEKLTGGMGEACALVEAAAKMYCPEDSTDLSRSIESKVETRGNSVIGTVFTPLEYAPYVEYGTGLFAEKGGRSDVPWKYQNDKGEWYSTIGQEPQPFLRPALNENRREIISIIKGGINSK